MDGISKLEHDFARYFGTWHAVACNSGTSALHLALLACGVGPGDEVIIPDFTMAAVQFAVCYTGARPILVDCDENMNLDPELARKAVTKRTKAIIAVHTYGKPCDMDRIMALKSMGDITVIEDCSEAHGATYKGRRVGQIGDISAFSLYRNKIVNAEEGGMVLTDSEKVASRVRDLKNMRFGCGVFKYRHTGLGFNYRMPEKQAELALKSLKNIGHELKRREKVEKAYAQLLPRMVDKSEGDVTWFYPAKVQTPALAIRSVPEARPFFYPLSRKEGGYAHRFWNRGLLLPMQVTTRQAKRIAKAVVASQA